MIEISSALRQIVKTSIAIRKAGKGASVPRAHARADFHSDLPQLFYRLNQRYKVS
jgi:hypothetical protein